MAKHGGYRKPTNPAPVSGPGRLSRRTDGGPAQNVTDLPNAKYGENRDYQQMQAGAPMAADPAPAAAPTTGAGTATAATPGAGASGSGIGGLAQALSAAAPAAPPTPLTQSTDRPNEPLTTGAPFGPGAGPAPEVQAPVAGRLSDTLQRLVGDDMTGEIADLYASLRQRGQ